MFLNQINVDWFIVSLLVHSLAGCATNEWKCQDGGCIKVIEQCDNYPHCKDSSDELNCTGILSCPEGLLSCRHRNGSYSCQNGTKCDNVTTNTSLFGNGIHLTSTSGNTTSTVAEATIKCISDGSCTAKDVTPFSPSDEDYKIKTDVVIGLAVGVSLAVIMLILLGVLFFFFCPTCQRQQK